jgi:hypothetical protein
VSAWVLARNSEGVRHRLRWSHRAHSGRLSDLDTYTNSGIHRLLPLSLLSTPSVHRASLSSSDRARISDYLRYPKHGLPYPNPTKTSPLKHGSLGMAVERLFGTRPQQGFMLTSTNCLHSSILVCLTNAYPAVVM